MARESANLDVDNIRKRIGRIEHQMRYLSGLANELLLAKKMLGNKENRKMIRKLKKVSQAKKVFARIMIKLGV